MSLVDDVRAWIQRQPAPPKPERPEPAPFAVGICRCCGDHFRIDMQGNVRTHGRWSGNLCFGSNMPPLEEI